MDTFGYPEALHVCMECGEEVVHGTARTRWFIGRVYDVRSAIANVPLLVRYNIDSNGRVHSCAPWPPNNADMHSSAYRKRDGTPLAPFRFVTGTSAWAMNELLRHKHAVRCVAWRSGQYVCLMEDVTGKQSVVQVAFKNGKLVQGEYHPDVLDLACQWELCESTPAYFCSLVQAEGDTSEAHGSFGFPEALHLARVLGVELVHGGMRTKRVIRCVTPRNNLISSVPILVSAPRKSGRGNVYRAPWVPDNAALFSTQYRRRDGRALDELGFSVGTAAWAFNELLRHGRKLRRCDWSAGMFLPRNFNKNTQHAFREAECVLCDAAVCQ